MELQSFSMLTILLSAEMNVAGEKTAKHGIIQSSTVVILNLQLSIKSIISDGFLAAKVVFKIN